MATTQGGAGPPDRDTMNASDLFIKALENEGVEVIYGVPGEENLDFLEALRKSSIQLILTRHEQGAGFMAATYGRLTGKAGVCLATLGPGATNLVTPAAYAQLGAFPMLMITGQKPIKESKQGQFQIVDIVDMMRPLTKYTGQVVNVNMIPSMVREAFRLAQEERPGGVHLELPEDIAIEQVDDTTPPVFEISKRRRGDADQSIINDAVDMIKGAKHPLLLIGAGANRKRIWKALSHFLDKTGIPFFRNTDGQGSGEWKAPALDRHSSLVGHGLRALCHQSGRPGHQRGPRRSRKAAFLHGTRRSQGCSHQLQIGHGGQCVFSAVGSSRGTSQHP